MTFGFTNIQVHTANRPSTEVRTALIEAVRQLFLDRSFVEVTDCAEADRTIFIAPTSPTSWIPIYDEAINGEPPAEELVKIIQALSAGLATSVVGLSLSDHVLRMLLYRNGELVDQFVSEPEYDEPAFAENHLRLQGHPELWQSLLASGAQRHDLQNIWNQSNLDRTEGIEDLAAVLGMYPAWIMSDWVDVEARDTFEQGTFPGADEFTTLCFRLVSPPYYKRRSEKPPAFVACGGTTALTFTVGHELIHGVGTMLYTSFRSVGKASRGIQIVLWGSAIEQRLIDPHVARLRLPHRIYPPSFELSYTEVPFLPTGRIGGLPAHEARAEDFDIPAGVADWEANTANQGALSWHRIYEASQLTEIGVSILGTAATRGNGDLYIGAMPLETLDQGLAYWRMEIEVIEK